MRPPFPGAERVLLDANLQHASLLPTDPMVVVLSERGHETAPFCTAQIHFPTSPFLAMWLTATEVPLSGHTTCIHRTNSFVLPANIGNLTIPYGAGLVNSSDITGVS
ncbi:hypothetical protein H6778_00815 [Candidatus Nomurabacteria bacterium]|nr:hypothetical protein [Candidatus Nomurabacteria bacterium]